MSSVTFTLVVRGVVVVEALVVSNCIRSKSIRSRLRLLWIILGLAAVVVVVVMVVVEARVVSNCIRSKSIISRL